MTWVQEGCPGEMPCEGPHEGRCKPVKQRFGVIIKLPGCLTFCPTLRHEEQIKIRREEENRKPRHPLYLLPSGGPWKSSAHLVTVFTQPAGHTLLAQGSPERPEWSPLPRIPEAPASGRRGSTPHRVLKSPWVVQRQGPPGTPQTRFRSLSGPSPAPGGQVVEEGFGSRLLNQEGRQGWAEQATGLRIGSE